MVFPVGFYKSSQESGVVIFLFSRAVSQGNISTPGWSCVFFTLALGGVVVFLILIITLLILSASLLRISVFGQFASRFVP